MIKCYINDLLVHVGTLILRLCRISFRLISYVIHVERNRTAYSKHVNDIKNQQTKSKIKRKMKKREKRRQTFPLPQESKLL